MDEKLYEPEVIQETPFPNEVSTPVISSGTPKTSGTYSPQTTKEKPYRKKVIAHETIAQALNTRSKKVLQEFELVQSGGFKVGNFEEGVSGDLRLTPNGITARDQAGITTFAIDGTTGDVVFKGTVQSGSLITGSILSDGAIDGGSMNINDRFVVNEEGDVVLGSDTLDVTAPSLSLYNSEGSLVVWLQGDVSVAKYLRANSVALGDTVFYENAVGLTGEIARLNVDDGLVMGDGKSITVQGTGASSNQGTNSATLYTDESGGKQRLMVIFPTGAAQQIAIEP